MTELTPPGGRPRLERLDLWTRIESSKNSGIRDRDMWDNWIQLLFDEVQTAFIAKSLGKDYGDVIVRCVWSWFTERSPTTTVYYGLQGCRQFTVRWTGTCRIRSCSRDSSGHSCRTFARDVVCGHRVTQDQQDPVFVLCTCCVQFWPTHPTLAHRSVSLASSIRLTMTIRSRHTPTTLN